MGVKGRVLWAVIEHSSPNRAHAQVALAAGSFQD